MKINLIKTKAMVIGIKWKKIDMRIKDESIKQVESFKYFGCNISSNINCCQEVKQRIAMAKEAFNRKKHFLQTLGKRTKEEASEVLCVECSIVWCRDLELQRNEQKRLEAFEMWICRRMEHVKWTK